VDQAAERHARLARGRQVPDWRVPEFPENRENSRESLKFRNSLLSALFFMFLSWIVHEFQSLVLNSLLNKEQGVFNV
jgi:hypothetical protein